MMIDAEVLLQQLHLPKNFFGFLMYVLSQSISITFLAFYLIFFIYQETIIFFFEVTLKVKSPRMSITTTTY